MASKFSVVANQDDDRGLRITDDLLPDSLRRHHPIRARLIDAGLHHKLDIVEPDAVSRDQQPHVVLAILPPRAPEIQGEQRLDAESSPGTEGSSTFIPHAATRLALSKSIIALTCAKFDVSEEAALSKMRQRQLAWSSFAMTWLMKKHCPWMSISAISRRLNRDHSTSLNALHTVDRLISETDARYNAAFKRLLHELDDEVTTLIETARRANVRQ
jgi:uncharacterized protein YecT (DUF1311 family)